MWQRKTVPKVSLLVNIGEIEWWWKFEHNLLIKLKHSMLCCAFDNVFICQHKVWTYILSLPSSILLLYLSQAWHQLIAPWFDGFTHWQYVFFGVISSWQIVLILFPCNDYRPFFLDVPFYSICKLHHNLWFSKRFQGMPDFFLRYHHYRCTAAGRVINAAIMDTLA